MIERPRKRVVAAYRESSRRFPHGGARFVIFSVLFFAIEAGVFSTSVLVIAGAWDLEGGNDTPAGITFLGIGLGLLALYWWMVTYLSGSKGDG